MTTAKKYINLPDLRKTLEQKGFTITETDVTSLNADINYDVSAVKPEVPKGKGAKKKSKLLKLSDQEIESAINKLTSDFPRIEKFWIDPPIPGQVHCSISFVPAKGATPDKDGLYGFMKVRGVFSNENDRDSNTEKIITDYDSYHEILHGLVGHPLPLLKDGDDRFVLETESVGLKKKMQKELSDDMKERRDKERKEIDEAQTRAKQAQEKEERAIQGYADPEEKYTTLRVKRANLIFAVYEMLKNIKRQKDTLLQTVSLIEKMDVEYPQFQNTFYQKYENAAKEVGVPTEKNFILRYLVGDIPFDLSIIPDEIPIVANAVNPGLSVFNPEDVVPQTVAMELANKQEKKAVDKGDQKETPPPEQEKKQ